MHKSYICFLMSYYKGNTPLYIVIFIIVSCELKKNVYSIVIQCKVRSRLLTMWFRSLIYLFISVYLIYFQYRDVL